MKIAFSLLLMMVFTAFAADDTVLIPPLQAIEQLGVISITDGTSFFSFSKDGSFQSGPLGISGRTFEGRWTTDGFKFIALTKQGWRNGLSSGHDYRRLEFVIFYVQQRPPDLKPIFGLEPPKLSESLFFVDTPVRVLEPTGVAPE